MTRDDVEEEEDFADHAIEYLRIRSDTNEHRKRKRMSRLKNLSQWMLAQTHTQKLKMS